MVAYVSGEGPARGAGIVASVIDAATDAASDYTTSAVVLLFTLAALSLVLLLKRLDDESARREAGGAATPNPDRALRRLLLPPDCLLSYIPPKRVGVVRRNWKPALYRLDPSALPSDTNPVLAFVNGKSGGRSGAQLLYHLRSCLNASQVVDLSEGGPEAALEGFCGTAPLPRVKILVCGGDGTVNWILDAMDKMQLPLDRRPPVAILPLGTGNDLARVLGWGSGGLYLDEFTIPALLATVDASHPTVLDRWTLTIDDPAAAAAAAAAVAAAASSSPKAGESAAAVAAAEVVAETTKKKRVPDRVFNNYFGVGVDSIVVNDFHQTRNLRPDLFFSQILNKETLLNRCADFKDVTVVKLDGKVLELPEGVQGIIVSNIESYAGGAKLWEPAGSGQSFLDDIYPPDNNNHQPASMQDGKLEVVAVMSAFHLGQIQVGLAQALKLGQARSIEIVTKRELPMQVDGEPWVQPAGRFSVAHHEKVFMCQRTDGSWGEVATCMSNTLDWALKEHHVSRQAHQLMLQKMSAELEAIQKSAPSSSQSPSLAPAESPPHLTHSLTC